MADYERHESGLLVPANFAEGDPPVTREVASTSDGRDITRGFVDPGTLQPPDDSVLRMRGAGDYRVYQEVLRDDQVFSTFQSRRLAVRSKEWEVVPATNKRQDKAAADFMAEQLRQVSWDDVTDKMLFGLFYGFAVAEMMYERDGRFVALPEIRVRNRRRFGFDGAGRLRLKTMSDPMGELMPERKFWHFHTGSDNDDEPYGLGLAHWLYWPTFFKRNDIKFWLIFLEKFGQPTAKGTYPANASNYEKRRLLQALEAINTDAGVAIPDGMQIDLIEATRTGTGDYEKLYNRMDAAIAKVILGQTASTEGTPGRLGGDDLQGDVRQDLTKADADLICESFNAGPGRWLTEWNFPNARPPRVIRKVEDKEDLNQTAERDYNIYQMGFKPTLKYIQDTYGGEWEERQQSPAGGGPGGPAPAFAEDDPTLAQKQADQLISGDGDQAVEGMVEKARALIDDVASLEELQDRLVEVYPDSAEEARAFSEALGDALMASNLGGRFDVNEQTGES